MTPAERAAARISHQLTYGRSPRKREFSEGLMTGPDIPCAYGSDLAASGDWEHGDDMIGQGQRRTEEEWVDQYAAYAINEAVHEALEWFRVDGKPWLNPHGKAQDRIYALVNELAAQLAAVRRTPVGAREAAARR